MDSLLPRSHLASRRVPPQLRISSSKSQMPAYVHKPRTYLHFDPPPPARGAEALVTDEQRVARHAFYPFLGFTVKTPKLEVDANGVFSRKHKERPIKLAAHLDAAIYSHYARVLSGAYRLHSIKYLS